MPEIQKVPEHLRRVVVLFTIDGEKAYDSSTAATVLMERVNALPVDEREAAMSDLSLVGLEPMEWLGGSNVPGT
jgi:hypothetical protein